VNHKDYDLTVGHCSNETHAEKKGDYITLDTFSFKGCWNCQFFTLDEDFMTTKEASEHYKVSRNTIRRWCKNKKLNAFLCCQQRFGEHPFFMGSPKIWLIKKDGDIK